MSGFFVMNGTSPNKSGLDQRKCHLACNPQQDRGDNRTRLSGLEGHPVFPVMPSSQGTASLSALVFQLPAHWRLELRSPGMQALYQLGCPPSPTIYPSFVCAFLRVALADGRTRKPPYPLPQGHGKQGAWECKGLWSSKNLD